MEWDAKKGKNKAGLVTSPSLPVASKKISYFMRSRLLSEHCIYIYMFIYSYLFVYMYRPITAAWAQRNELQDPGASTTARASVVLGAAGAVAAAAAAAAVEGAAAAVAVEVAVAAAVVAAAEVGVLVCPSKALEVAWAAAPQLHSGKLHCSCTERKQYQHVPCFFRGAGDGRYAFTRVIRSDHASYIVPARVGAVAALAGWAKQQRKQSGASGWS